MITREQVSAAQVSNLDTLFNLTTKAFAGVEKLVQLNTQFVKTALTENLEGAKRIVSAKDAQEFLEAQAALVQPMGEKAMAYSRHFYEIATETQKDIAGVAKERLAEGSQKVRDAFESFAKNAPAGSEPALAMVKQAFAAADNAIESVEKATAQVVEIAETNLQAATNAATKAAEQATATVRAASKKAAAAA